MPRLNGPARIAVTALALAAAPTIVSTASASQCSLSPGAQCRNAHMPTMAGRMSMAGADMSGSDMRGADMRNMDLSNTNLSGTDLRGAKMHGAKMNGTNLSGANMTGMTMRNMTMRRVRMTNTKMRHMRMINVNMVHSSMRGVDARGSRFIGGGMPGSLIVRSRFGPMPSGNAGRARESAWTCLNAGGQTFAGRYIGYPWQSDYNFNGTVFTDSNLHCATFSYVTWSHAAFVRSNLTNTQYYGDQNLSQQILAIKSDFSGAAFNSTFWAPAVANQVTLNGASCPAIVNGDPSNGTWGRYNFVSPYSVNGGWKYGIVTGTAFGNITYQSQPVPVVLTNAQQNLLTQEGWKRPYLTVVGTNCGAQTAPDWLGGGY